MRGLDYYTKTAYEILSGDLGAQNAVAGGGRYDNLSGAIGGSKIPGVGFACGLDRVMLVMEEQGCNFGDMPKTEIYVAALDDNARGAAQLLTHELRKNKIPAACDTSGKSFKAQMKIAGTCKFACIIGAEEIANNTVSIKNMSDGSQINVPMGDAIKKLDEKIHEI